MKRPLLFLLIFLTVGILSCIYIESKIILFIIFLLTFLFSIYFSKIYKIKLCDFLWVISILGYILTSFNTTLSNLDMKILNEENVSANGVIKDVNLLSNGDFSVKIKINTIKLGENKIHKNFYITSYLEYNENIKEGYEINFSGKFSLGKLPTNPNEFNEYVNLKSNGIDFKVYIKDYEILNLEDKFTYYISNLNYKIGNIYDGILPEEESAILKAMILGDKQYLNSDIVELYRNSGIYHILAISGLHIGILAVFLNKIFDKINRKYGKLFVIIILILYCILTGGSLSTIRATFMSCIMLIGSMIYRDYDIISSISFSAIILLIINPYNILNIGFLYSYVSVFSIGFLGMGFIKKYNLNGIKSSLIVSFFVSLAIKPITAYYFYNFNTIDFLLNLVIIPFTSIVVCVGFIVSIIGMISLTLAEFFIGIVYYIFRFFTFMCKIIDNMSFNNIDIERPSIFFIVIFYLMLVLIGYALYEKNLYRKREKFIKLGLIIFLIGISAEIFKNQEFTITMLDVGQGDCIIGENGSDTFIIDGGGGFSKNVGKKVIIPYLESKNIHQLDFVFITHMDSDHIDGILDIIGSIKIDNIFIPSLDHTSEKYFELIQLSNENKINLYMLKNGDELNLGNDINFKILHPQIQFNEIDDNNNSLVIKMEYMTNSVLFTGDIEKDAEYIIMPYLDNVDILKIAHHGSKTSTTDEFFKRVMPKVSLISCGKNNIYNHPNQETLETIKQSKIYRTDKDGAIIIKFNENSYKIKTVLSRR